MRSLWPQLLFCLLALCGQCLQAAGNPYDSGIAPKPSTKVDAIIFERLAREGLKPSNLCSDAVFVRRVYLDVIGTLPTAEEARVFIRDKSPSKRSALIDALFNRPEFADYWALKWSDLLRVKAEFPINLWPNAAQAYHRWIHTAMRDNLPFDRFATELLTSNGSNFRVAPVNFYRALQSKEPKAIAQAVALAFMGERAEKWPAGRMDAMAPFFAQIAYKPTGEWKEEIVHFDPTKKIPDALPSPAFPDGSKPDLSSGQDPRKIFAAWLVDPRNPALARAFANRAWFWFLGRGIIHEPDDIRPDNAPSHPELLDYLRVEFASHAYDVRHLFRLILNSQTYQLSSVPADGHTGGEHLFGSYPLRRLEAEVLIDAYNQVTGTNEKYSSPIPEPFTFLPDDQRSIALPDGSITSSFLELFGKSPRDTGLELERNNRINASQRLHLLNSSHIRRKLEGGPKINALLRPQGKLRDNLDLIYLTFLSRYPTEEEWALISGRMKGQLPKKGLPRELALDVIWALANSVEFVFRH